MGSFEGSVKVVDVFLELQHVAEDIIAKYDFNLVGVVNLTKFVPLAAIQYVFKQANACGGLWTLDELKGFKERSFTLSFEREEDWKAVLERQPWWINADMLMLVDCKSNIPMTSLSFETLPVWVRPVGVPPSFLSRDNALKIA